MNKYQNKGKEKNSSKSEYKSKEDTQTKNGINLDYDWNTEYGDGDIPDIDKQ